MGSLTSERESHKILDVPAFIETAAKDDVKTEEREGNEKLKPSPEANRDQVGEWHPVTVLVNVCTN